MRFGKHIIGLAALALTYLCTAPAHAYENVCSPSIPGQCAEVDVNDRLLVAPVPTTVSNGGDPCGGTKSYADFESGTSGGQIVGAAGTGKKTYLCSISIVTSTAASVSLIEGTGSSVCTGGTPAGLFLNTGTTAANGAAFAANGGIQAGNGGATVAGNGTANYNICVAFTTTNSPQVNVHVSYVQQ